MSFSAVGKGETLLKNWFPQTTVECIQRKENAGFNL